MKNEFIKEENINLKIGNKILELRKKSNLSQENLSELLGVSRQTISKWETGETSPDLKQAASISKIFNVSLDELVDNNIKEVIVEKVSNTEALAGIIIKILKVIGILFLVFLIIDIVALILFSVVKNENSFESITQEVEMICSINEEDYIITVGSDGYFNCSNCSKEIQKELKENYIDFSDINNTTENINKYFINNNGICE